MVFRGERRTVGIRRALLIVGVFFACSGAQGQPDSVVSRLGSTITAEGLREHLEILASDSFLGRETGKEGQKRAAAYLRDCFQSMGVPPLDSAEFPGIRSGYFQPYRVIESKRGRTELYVDGHPLRRPDQYFYLNEVLQEPFSIRHLRLLSGGELDSSILLNGAHVILRTRSGGGWTKNELRPKLDLLISRGVEVCFVVLEDVDFNEMKEQVHLEGTSMKLAEDPTQGVRAPRSTQVFFVAEGAVRDLLGRKGARRFERAEEARLLRVKLRVGASRGDTILETENVLAFVQGTSHPEELVVISAHYDHIGEEGGVVYNGADDDGSGTAALLEIAEALVTAKREGRGPARSVLIMPVSGEEKGLLGSRYYSDNPVFELERTIANLNIDMIGRIDSAHSGSDNYVYIIGSDRLSTDLHNVNEKANAEYVRLTLDYAFNAEDDPNRFYYRSDHYNFARKGIPCIFYFSGVHEDYHQAGDDVEKIRFDLLEKRARLVFHTAWQLANQPSRIRVDGGGVRAR